MGNTHGKDLKNWKRLIRHHRRDNTESSHYENSQAQASSSATGENHYDLVDEYEKLSFPGSDICTDIVVVAVDFGTSSSGYALSMYDEYIKDPLIIRSFTWTSKLDGIQHYKTLTAVLLDPDQKFHSFGYDAQWNYVNLEEDDQKRYYYFHHFKMKLYNEQAISRDLIIHDLTGKPMPAITVFSHAISYMKDHVLQNIAEQVSGIKEDDIAWVLTVPAIWSEKAKQFMRQAAGMSGIKNNRLSIALEPEAAALYCRHVPIDRKHNSIDEFQPGTGYLVVDLGGGTVDITAHKIRKDKTLVELTVASGGDLGSNGINNDILAFLEEVTYPDIFAILSEKFPEDYLLLLSTIEQKKTTFSPADKSINISFPTSLREVVEVKTDKRLEECLGKNSSVVMCKRDKLIISPAKFIDILQSTIQKIVLKVMAILSSAELKRNIQTILLVGGFSECRLLKDSFKTAFPDIRFIIPKDANIAVLKGAVLFGRHPNIVKVRCCRYTYGIKTKTDFRPGVHPVFKRIVEDGKELVKDIFSPHILIHQVIESDKELQGKIYRPTYDQQSDIELEVYATLGPCPMFVTEPGVTFLGKLIVDVPKECRHLHYTERKIYVRFVLSGPELEVIAEDKSSGKKAKARLEFLG